MYSLSNVGCVFFVCFVFIFCFSVGRMQGMFFFHLCLVRVLDSMRQSLFCTD